MAEPEPTLKQAALSPVPSSPEQGPAPCGCCAQRSTTSHRRGFLSVVFGLLIGSPLAIGFTTLATSYLLWLLGSVRFMFPNLKLEPPSRFKAGYPADLAPGQVDTRHTVRQGAWIVRHEYEGQPQIFALKAVCTHLGCTPVWLEAEAKFKCPCHGSGFYRDGINFEGPAPRPLERFAIRVAEDGRIEVDKSRTFQQELGGWADPASFVAV